MSRTRTPAEFSVRLLRSHGAPAVLHRDC